MLKVKVVKSSRGRGKGCAQNICFDSGEAFVTGAYSAIDWDTKEYLIARLARVWNMTEKLSDVELAVIEAHLTKYAPDVASATSAEPDSGLESVPAVESDTQPRG